MSDPGFDLTAYLTRIGLSGARDLAALHRAQVTSIPFENLDPHRGVPVSLEPEALAAKLVHGGRGGYCFEHNSLLMAALRTMGAEVDPLLARVRLGRIDADMRPRTHLALRVRWEGSVWLADVGFGSGGLMEPIPFGPGEEHEQNGWRLRIVQDGAEHVLQSATGDGWRDLYGFVPEPVPRVDIETSNWFTATYPRSPFVMGILVAAQRTDGTRSILTDWGEPLRLNEEAPDGAQVIPVAREDVPELLEERFGLPGFTLRDGRVEPL